MKQFLITEEERNRILNLHEERTSRHYLMEQTTGVTQSSGTTQTSGSTPTLVSGPFGNPDRKQYVYNVNGKFFIYYTTPANSTPAPEKGNPFTNNGQGFATEGQATAKIKQMTPNQEELQMSNEPTSELDEELIEGYENSLYSDIMELIHDSNSSHEETIDVLNSIVDEMSSSRRMRRNVERRFRDDMNEDSLYSESREDGESLEREARIILNRLGYSMSLLKNYTRKELAKSLRRENKDRSGGHDKWEKLADKLDN